MSHGPSGVPAAPGRPVAVAPIRSVLLATDLGTASAEATDRAFQLAAGLHAELLVVSVIDPGQARLPGGRFGARLDQLRAERESAATALVARGRGLGVPVRFLVWDGDPGESIVEAAAAEDADLIVVGTHGRGAVGRLLLGSVSNHVVRHASVPVVVVRPTTEPAA